LNNEPITYLEFGTHQGRSMRWWLSLCPNPDSRFVGFDTFEGLPEAWEGLSQGHFSTKGKTPDIKDPRCSFVAGLFQQTLPEFLRTYKPAGRQIIHVDADLFSSALFVLNQIGPITQAGDIYIFDEFHVWMDEFRAFQLFLCAFPFRYKVLFRSPDWSQVAIKITET
jgi:hypothetical protein